MKIEKASRRDNKYQKREKMVVDSRSVFTIEKLQKQRAKEIKMGRKIKETNRNS